MSSNPLENPLLPEVIEGEVIARGEDKAIGFQRRIGNPNAVIALDLLEEIADRLRTIEETMAAEHPQGIAKMRKFRASGPEQVEMRFTDWKRFAVSIWNDGPDKVYVRINDKTDDNPIELNRNEKADLDMRTALIEKLYFNCDSGLNASGVAYNAIGRVVGRF